MEIYVIQEIVNRIQGKCLQERGQILEDFGCQEYSNSLEQYFSKHRINTSQEIILGATMFIALNNIGIILYTKKSCVLFSYF